MIGSLGNLSFYKPSNYVLDLGLIFVVDIKFPPATYHTIVPSTEEFYSLNRTYLTLGGLCESSPWLTFAH